jgi:hypothetical protein
LSRGSNTKSHHARHNGVRANLAFSLIAVKVLVRIGNQLKVEEKRIRNPVSLVSLTGSLARAVEHDNLVHLFGVQELLVSHEVFLRFVSLCAADTTPHRLNKF